MKKIYFFALTLFFGLNTFAQIINFPDANFKAKLLAANPNNSTATNTSFQPCKIDLNNNLEIELSEVLLINELQIEFSNIASLVGIENFSNLKKLYAANNNITTVQPLNTITGLKVLHFNLNQVTTLTGISNLINLTELNCGQNLLTNLNGIATLTNLQTFYCGNSNLYSIAELNNLTNLTGISVSGNYLNSFDQISNLVNLNYLDCRSNPFVNLNLSQFQNLGVVELPNTIINLFIKNGANETLSGLQYCENLKYICADQSQISIIQYQLNQFVYPGANCQVNSYCTFSPGGNFYTIQGNTKYDGNLNGCNSLDPNIPYTKINTSNGTLSGTFISDSSGNFTIPVSSGTHTITPVLENPSYFTISPANSTIAFPAAASPAIRNFCVTANGTHNDTEVVLVPYQRARPGFDSFYKLVFKNKGNFIQSGTVNLVYNDAVSDFVTSIPATNSQTVNNLSWNFSNLNPLESREIVFSLHLNSPMASPPVNSGFVLNFNATIASLTPNDEIPTDNTFLLNQVVVNSFDPNDKMCLEGISIPSSKVGDYVHYMIRFQNDGTASAQNIVVKDIIDSSKFDIATLIPETASHAYYTRINNTNTVEFIFQNINLPFATGTNQGYVAFKIKTKPTLVLGNTFSNSANIYFDYNFPIVTNTTTTSIVALFNQDFEFSNYFSVSPNPAQDFLNINSKEGIEISSLSIFNVLGQVVQVVPNAKDMKTINVSQLKTGNYFIKINSDKGTTSTKFIKQ
jgi:Secretion system C-terminal sorting domain